jgi:hypothetical protein
MIRKLKNWLTRYLVTAFPHRRRYRGWGELAGKSYNPRVRVVGAYFNPQRRSAISGTCWVFRWEHPVTGGIVESHEINFA